jgi:hypothetical protein
MGCNKRAPDDTYTMKDFHLIVRASCNDTYQDPAEYHERSPIKDIDNYSPCGVFSDDLVKRCYVNGFKGEICDEIRFHGNSLFPYSTLSVRL